MEAVIDQGGFWRRNVFDRVVFSFVEVEESGTLRRDEGKGSVSLRALSLVEIGAAIFKADLQIQ